MNLVGYWSSGSPIMAKLPSFSYSSAMVGTSVRYCAGMIWSVSILSRQTKTGLVMEWDMVVIGLKTETRLGLRVGFFRQRGEVAAFEKGRTWNRLDVAAFWLGSEGGPEPGLR